MLTEEELNVMTIAELETHMDEERDEVPRSYLKKVMAVRNQKIEQEKLDHWGLTKEQYDAAKYKSEEHRRHESDHHEALVNHNKLSEKLKALNDKQFSGTQKEVQDQMAQVVLEKKQLEKEIAEAAKLCENCEKDHEHAKKTAVPLHVHLNLARRKSLQESRHGQTAIVKSITSTVKGKGT